MRLYKKELNKLCKVTWYDARSEIRTELAPFIKEGFAIIISVGWLKYFDKKYEDV